MCGRYTMSTPAEVVAEMFDLLAVPPLDASYNIAPTHTVPVVLQAAPDRERELRLLRWGLIPAWADDPAIGSRLINARSETVATKPAIRSSFRQRRCLIVADGFYEWRKLARSKQPMYVRMVDGRPFAFAGLWEHWEGPGGTTID
jgi:putative SOS response-associated peptidase YedK